MHAQINFLLLISGIDDFIQNRQVSSQLLDKSSASDRDYFTDYNSGFRKKARN